MRVLFGVLALSLAGCDLPSASPSTGGTSFDGGGPSGDGGAPVRGCDRGVAIVLSDFRSTNIAIANLRGSTLSGSIVSSGSAKPGLSLALSGDVDVPFVAPASQRLLLIDRYGANVLTWMALDTATVLGQLAIGTGFEANPHDYVEVDDTRAFVSRYGTNTTPGALPFDEGGDLLVIDTQARSIVGRIPMPEEDPALLPRPDGMVWLGSDVVVGLGRWSADFTRTGDGRFVGVSPFTNAVEWAVDVVGLQACGRLAVSPSGKWAAIACSSRQDTATNKYDPTKSDIVIYDATTNPPSELRRLGIAARLGAGLQPQLVFATENELLAMTYGGNSTPGDTLFAVSALTGEVTPLAEATKAFVFGGVRCSPGCGDVCLASDAERNKLRRWQVRSDGTFTELDDVVVETLIGLPPRTLGGL